MQYNVITVREMINSNKNIESENTMKIYKTVITDSYRNTKEEFYSTKTKALYALIRESGFYLRGKYAITAYSKRAKKIETNWYGFDTSPDSWDSVRTRIDVFKILLHNSSHLILKEGRIAEVEEIEVH